MFVKFIGSCKDSSIYFEFISLPTHVNFKTTTGYCWLDTKLFTRCSDFFSFNRLVYRWCGALMVRK